MNLSREVVAVAATTLTLSFILVLMRLYSTTRITRSASYEDCATVLALVFSIAYASLVIDTKNYARHGWDLPITAYDARYFKIIFSETIIGAFAFSFSKLSILFLLGRLFATTRTFRYLGWHGIAWTALISMVSIFVDCALCAPRPGESWGSSVVAKSCAKMGIWAVVQEALFVALDFYISFLPIPIVLKLQMSFKKKFGVLAIFMTGMM